MVKVVTVRKDHSCSSVDAKGLLCPRPINKGEKAKVESLKFGRVSGSYFQTSYYHMECPMRRPYE